VFELSGTEAVGYVASALVVLSLTMTSVVRLRSISLIGSVIFGVYGALISSVPIMMTNTAIAGINIWFLRAELGNRRDLGAVLIDARSPFLVDFVHFHLDDIHRFQPSFEMPEHEAICILLTREGLPAGALIGTRRDHELDIALDYVLRAYRDSRLGHWLFGRGSGVFRANGITRLVSAQGDEVHRAYLERMGFHRDGERFTLDLG